MANRGLRRPLAYSVDAASTSAANHQAKTESPMSPQDTPRLPPTLDRFALERRRFLIEGATGAGALGILASLGLSRYAIAQSAATAPSGSAHPGMPALPPEPKVSQAAPLHDLQGKVAYITAASDGIGLGIARVASAAGIYPREIEHRKARRKSYRSV